MLKKRILPVIAGVISGWIIVAISDTINHQIYPPPEGFDPTNKEAIKVFAETLPNQAFIYMIIGWAISVFVGGLVTRLLAKENWKRLCLITGGILLLASIGNMMMIPQPIWVNAIVVVMYLPLAYLGGKTIKSKKDV